MAQSYFYPPAGGGSNPSVGPNGQPITTSSTLIAGEGPTGLQTPVAVAANGAVIVDDLTPASVVTVVQPNGALLHATIDASALPAGAATSANQATEIASLSSIDGKIVHVDTGNVTVVASALPTGAATAANQVTGNNSLASIDSKLTAPLSVTGPLTDTQLRASPVPVSAASLPLPSGAATAANQVTGNNSLASIDGKIVHVDTDNVTVIASALPTGAATQALQISGNASLTTIAARTTSLDNKTVHVDTDSVTVVASALPTGAATQTTLAAISAQLPSTLGQHTSAASLGVVIASDQSGVPVKSTPVTPPASTITQVAKTVGTTAVRMTVSGSAPSATRVLMAVTPDSASTAKFYIGSSSVTSTGSTRGIQIVAGQNFVANNDAGDYYIVSDTASQTVYVMEQG